jgi:teichuronic acid biosynthesis glycosyltransferase TuaH
VGYVGSLNFRLDASLLEAARRANAGGTLVLVGGRFAAAPDPATARLLTLPDVVSVPQQPPSAVPGIMASLDAGIVPYSIHPFNRKSFPIKILQYLAAGLPVVSTPNGATDELGEHVLVAEDPPSFGAAVGRALDRSAQDQAEARRAVAMARPWTRVASELVEVAGMTR